MIIFFSSVSKKKSLRIILTLVAHYNLKLHQMNVKTVFLDGDLHEEIYIKQHEYFIVKDKGRMRCRFKQLIYRLKQALR
jgi:Reverse transcriptase (RNA-dependent DNA polymerase)